MKEYLPRIIDSILDEKMKFAGGIYLRGPKWCGKSTSAKRKAKTIYNLSDSTTLKNLKTLYLLNPKKIFNDLDCPILFDEWQVLPKIWDDGRNFIDESAHEGTKIFLTGSAVLSKKEIKENIHHSGVGRYVSLMMRPLSLYESKESNGKISLNDLFDKDFEIGEISTSLTKSQILFDICRGGWPDAVLQKDDKSALDIPKHLLDAITERDVDDILDFSGRKKNSVILERILRSYSRNISTFALNSTIIRDVRGGNQYGSFSEATFYAYRDYLASFFLFEDVESWSPLFKSRVNMNSLPKKEFVDPSLAVAAGRLSPEKLESFGYDAGFLFENLVIRDLRVYSLKDRGQVFYYHDRTGLECDAVLVLDDGRYALIEIKFGENDILSATENLTSIKEKIIAYNERMVKEGQRDRVMDLPSALVVITGTQKAFTTTTGIHIVPIGCLKD